MTSISSSLTSATTLSSQLFAKIDSDGNGAVAKEEFLSGRPDGVSESQAAQLFDAIDSDGSGDVSEAELSDHVAEKSGERDGAGLAGNLSSDMLNTILELLSGDGTADDGGAGSAASEIFEAMDSDGSGDVSEAEFVAARPENMSEEEAVELFSRIDTEGSGAISSDQFAAAMTPPSASGGGSGEESYDSLDTNQDGVVDAQEMLAALGASDNGAASTQDDLATRLLQQFEEAIEAYAAAGRETRGRSAELMADA